MKINVLIMIIGYLALAASHLPSVPPDVQQVLRELALYLGIPAAFTTPLPSSSDDTDDDGSASGGQSLTANDAASKKARRRGIFRDVGRSLIGIIANHVRRNGK